MTVDLNSGTGVYDRLGHLGALLESLDDEFVRLETSLETLVNSKTTSAQREDEAGLLNQVRCLHRHGMPIQEAIRRTAIDLVITMVDDDTPLPKRDLPSALAELDRQMRSGSKGLAHTPPGSSVAADAANTGDGEAIISLVDRFGEPLRFTPGEDLRLECVRDGQPGGGTPVGAEEFSVTGERERPFWDPRYPGGSMPENGRGGGAAFISSAGAIANGRGLQQNLLVNGNFASGAVDAFSKWDAVAGVYGTNFVETATSLIAGGRAIEIVGDGATLHHLRQKLNDAADGSPVQLEPRTHYALSFWMRRDATPAALGTMDAKITDDSGTLMTVNPTHGSAIDAKVSVDLTALTTSFVKYSIPFVTPALVPAQPELGFLASAALTVNRSVFLSDPVLQKMSPAYLGGPQMALHRGAAAWVVGDVLTATIIRNDTDANLLWVLERLLGVRATRQTIPTLAAPNIVDALLTEV